MNALHLPNRKTQYQSILLLGLVAFFIAHFTLLNPSGLEEDFSEVRSISPQELLSFFQNEKVSLAKNVPTQETPAYALRDTVFYSTDVDKKQWKMVARKSFVYQTQQMVHTRDVVFFWADGQVSAKEALSFEKSSEIELFGDVVVTLNNGLVVNTHYVKIITTPFNQILIPVTEPLWGHDQVNKKTMVTFKANGLDYNASTDDLKLLSQVDATIQTDKASRVQSDIATYHKKEGVLYFEMAQNQPLDKQFVKTHQEAMDLQSRNLTAVLENQKLQVLTAKSDAKFQDYTNKNHPVTGTAGKVIYKEGANLLFLMDFPQLYQDKDTITGDTIIYNRTNDTIEVEQSNVFNKR